MAVGTPTSSQQRPTVRPLFFEGGDVVEGPQGPNCPSIHSTPSMPWSRRTQEVPDRRFQVAIEGEVHVAGIEHQGAVDGARGREAQAQPAALVNDTGSFAAPVRHVL